MNPAPPLMNPAPPLVPPIAHGADDPDNHQVGGTHYRGLSVQPWNALQAWLTDDQFQGYLLGSAIAYLSRYNVAATPGKGGVQDLRKARHVLDKLIATTTRGA